MTRPSCVRIGDGAPFAIEQWQAKLDAYPSSAKDEAGATRTGGNARIQSAPLIVNETGAPFVGPMKSCLGLTVLFQDTSDITVLGQLRVNADVVNPGPIINDHLHSVLLLKARRDKAEATGSIDARDDNVSVNDRDESRYRLELVIWRESAHMSASKDRSLHEVDVIVGTAGRDTRAGDAWQCGGSADVAHRHNPEVVRLDMHTDGPALLIAVKAPLPARV